MKQKESGLFNHSENVKIDVFKFKAFDKLGLKAFDSLFFSYYLLYKFRISGGYIPSFAFWLTYYL